MKNRSQGARHSAAVKRGMMRYREPFTAVASAEQRANQAARNARIWRGMVALLSKVNMPIPTPDDVEKQLKHSWKAGYIQALRDVRRERERMEAHQYLDALPQITIQEARKISHIYEK